MPTNANVFNSRVTSEALEAKFREVFPAQGGAELVQDLFASGVIQPVVDFSSVAEGSVLPEFLQTAWDYASTQYQLSSGTGATTVANTAGFWKVWIQTDFEPSATQELYINDGLSSKRIWKMETTDGSGFPVVQNTFYVWLRSGDSLIGNNTSPNDYFHVTVRQVADSTGTLVNPLGFTFS